MHCNMFVGVSKALICFATHVFNPRCTYAARVTVVGLSVCLCVCLFVNISLQEHLFAFKMLSHTQQATKVEICICGIFSQIRVFQRWSVSSLGWPYIWSAIFLQRTCMHMQYWSYCSKKVHDVMLHLRLP